MPRITAELVDEGDGRSLVRSSMDVGNRGELVMLVMAVVEAATRGAEENGDPETAAIFREAAQVILGAEPGMLGSRGVGEVSATRDN